MDSTTFVCDCCGKVHVGWPSLTFKTPDSYDGLTQDQKDTIAEIDSDFCVISYPDQTDRFIRVTMTQKVNDDCQDLDYGLWVSLSEKSFQDYSDNYENENHEVIYFGWLCNSIPEYTFEKSIPTTVHTRKGNKRPEIVPHEDFDHPFVRDYYNGISKKEAQSRIQNMLDRIQKTSGESTKRPWWKFW